VILHIDMDAFFASIEQAINPRLKGKPLIVGSRPSKLHTVVCAASYEAKALGIGSGMSSQEAFQLCPGLEFVPAQQGRYIWTSEQILELLKGYGFETVYASIDEFQLDIGEETDGQALAQTIQKQIQKTFNITASIGIAKNWLLAKLASKLNKPNGIAILTEANLNEVLGRVPVEKLCGVGKATQEVLQNLSIQTCLDLYQKPADFLEQIFGKNGANLYISLHSTDRFDTLDFDPNPKSVGHSYTLPYASQNQGFIRAWIRLLAEMVAERLRQKNLTSHTVHLWLTTPETGNFGAQQTFQQASNDGYEVYSRCLKIMAKTGLRNPRIRALGVTCASLAVDSYPPLFIAQKRREALLKAVDKINDRYGDGSIYPAVVSLTRKMQ
jgi:DNA polymerase IV